MIYPKPSLTADAVIFSHNSRGQLTLLLIKRGNPPFVGHWALPGGFVNEGEQAAQAAVRELQEETGLTNATGMRMVGFYDTPGRDPRGWTVSVAFSTIVEGEPYAKGQDDAAEAQWFPVDALPDLAFDHATIIADALRIIVPNR